MARKLANSLLQTGTLILNDKLPVIWGCPAKQTKHVFRFISPDDYDEAVRQDMFSCPHFITGDRRSGRQLIADAATDAHIQLAGMTAAIRGRMELDALAAFVESTIATLD
jgi:hypothetical protein